jgi:hypothetical protein
MTVCVRAWKRMWIVPTTVGTLITLTTVAIVVMVHVLVQKTM